MTTARNAASNNHNTNLKAAMALLIRNQAEAVAEHREMSRELAALKKESDARWARIEALLLEHDRMLRELPEAIRLKIGYRK